MEYLLYFLSEFVKLDTHLGKVIYGCPPLMVDDFIRFMYTHRIEKSIVLPLVNPEKDYYYTTEQAIEDCKLYPDRPIPFANIDPRRSTNNESIIFLILLKKGKSSKSEKT